jgi:hypothetical protein
LRFIYLFIVLSITGCQSTAVKQQDVTFNQEYLASKTVDFSDEKYSLGWSDKKKNIENYEYFLPKETQNKWTKLFSVRRIAGFESASPALKQYIKQIKPPRTQLFANNHDNGNNDITVFFHLASSDLSYFEYNLVRFVYDTKSKTVFSYQFAIKSPVDLTNEELRNFSKMINENKAMWVNLLAAIEA